MPIIDIRDEGDIFTCGADVIVIPVNLRGAMGRGLAQQLARLSPTAASTYRDQCSSGDWELGSMRVVGGAGGLAPSVRYVVFFPTKLDWRKPSRLEWIEEGLDDLVALFDVGGIELNVLAVPALGCGEGKLDWKVVEPLIVSKLHGLYMASRVILFASRADEQEGEAALRDGTEDARLHHHLPRPPGS